MTNQLRSDHPSSDHGSWEWALGLGFLMIILGIVAIAAPFEITAGLSWLVGVLLLVAGIAQLIHAFRFHSSRGRGGQFVLAALGIVAGAVTMRYPLIGAIGLTSIMSFYLLLSGMSRLILAIELRPVGGWGFIFVSALFSFALGVILLATFPTSSLIVPGLFFGVDMLFFGSSSIFYSMDLKKAEKKIGEREEHKAA